MQRRTVGRRSLGAVLFTDIVGSTAIAAEMGNTRWSELVSRHHRLIRRELRRFGGREQDTAGDGFFATFGRPVDALRCAVAATEAVRALGVEIRAGVSFGQLELVEGKAGGLIVNTAARVMSVAGAGEVLVPAAVKDLVPGTGISFDDHGAHSLKGIGGELRLFRVTEVDGRPPAEPLDPEDAADRREAILPTARRRAGLVAGLLAAAVVAAVGIWALAGNDPTEPRTVPTPARFVVEFEAETGDERQLIAYPNPGRPELARLGTAMAAGQGAVWIEDPTAYVTTILRVDPRHREIRRVVLGPSYSFAMSVATAFDSVWVATDRLIRINPATNESGTVLRIPLPVGGLGTSSLAVDRRHLWIGTSSGMLLRVDASGEVTARRSVTDGIQEVATGEGGVWVVDQVAGVVVRVDPTSLRKVAEVPLTGSIDAIAVMGDHVWVLDFGTGVLTRISILQDRPVGQVTVPASANSLAAGLGAVWIGHGDGAITKVDPLTVRASAFARIGGSIRAIAVDAARKSIWVDARRA
jgi:class 3 adenylate cyclase/outer membrane protein assembly factor BamB